MLRQYGDDKNNENGNIPPNPDPNNQYYSKSSSFAPQWRGL